ncbi:MAG: hypothetical protein HRU21_09970 [Pseudomonadales bacterium]|nr:hypothetical protein [Pseudomonadales bacterium]
MSRLCIIFIISALSACATYSTNTDIAFDGLRVDQKPEVLLTAEGVEASKIDYLGWVVAEVNRPSFFHSKPTKAQADIVLAHLAKQRGAQAVLFVEYDWNAFGNLSARGQAILLEGQSKPPLKQRVEQRQQLELEEKIQNYADTAKSDPNNAIILDVEDDPLAAAYMAANPIEQQLKDAGPNMVELPEAALLSVIDELTQLQTEAYQAKNISLYATVTDLLYQLKQYQ